MSALYGECLLAYEKIVNDNLDAFTRKGFDLHFIDPSGKTMNFGFQDLKTWKKLWENSRNTKQSGLRNTQKLSSEII